jgi:hypothetical protein
MADPVAAAVERADIVDNRRGGANEVIAGRGASGVNRWRMGLGLGLGLDLRLGMWLL